MTEERWSGIDRRSGEDRRSGVDSRPIQDQRFIGERRSSSERRSGLKPRLADVSPAENFAQQVQGVRGAEQKLDLLARAMLELMSSVAEIERRVRSIQQSTARNRF
jgi:hypothetical protein